MTILNKVSGLLRRFRASSARGSVPPSRSSLTHFRTRCHYDDLGLGPDAECIYDDPCPAKRIDPWRP